MLCKDVYELLLDIARKDKRGNSLEVDEFNRAALMVNQRIYSHYYSLYETSFESSDSLDAFRMNNTQVSLSAMGTTSAIGTLPTDYYRIVGIPRYVDGSDVREVDVVTAIEFTKRQVDYLTRPTTKHPIVSLGGLDSSDRKEIRVLPNTITAIRIDYLREATTPFLDYYTDDTNLTYTFLDEGDQNIPIPTGNTYRDGSTSTQNSQTVDFEWGDSDLSLVISLFIQVLGWQLEDEMLLQVGNAEEIKNIQ
jgi:hypothetical protein